MFRRGALRSGRSLRSLREKTRSVYNLYIIPNSIPIININIIFIIITNINIIIIIIIGLIRFGF